MATGIPVSALKRSVAVVIRGPEARAESGVLAVRRPPDDADLPGIWGLPAASLRWGESWEAAARRAGRDKLGVALEVMGELREGTRERPGYTLNMKLYEARIVEGEPRVPRPVDGVTQYTDWRWASAGDLAEGARLGSLCCQLYLDL